MPAPGRRPGFGTSSGLLGRARFPAAWSSISTSMLAVSDASSVMISPVFS